MNEDSKITPYPRKVLLRFLLQSVGRLIIFLLFKIAIIGKENFPEKGPLIVVGNHTAIMEAVLVNIFSPWQIEMMGAADIPHEKISQIFSDLYGFIPVNRGHVDRSALQKALNVLKQNGIVGIFPEGGIWEPGLMRAQTGVAWLSYRGQTSVLPIGFSGTLGSLDQALKLKRPQLTMKIGKVIPPIQEVENTPRKILFQNYAEEVMVKVRSLILPADPSLETVISNERFKLSIIVKDKDKTNIPIPEDKRIKHDTSLVKFLHRPAILKIFYANLSLPIEVLLNIAQNSDPQAIIDAVKLILHYLDNENPYLLTYRFGPKIGEEMKLGLQELLKLSKWASNHNYSLHITPTRLFFSIRDNQEIIQTRPEKFEHWM